MEEQTLQKPKRPSIVTTFSIVLVLGSILTLAAPLILPDQTTELTSIVSALVEIVAAVGLWQMRKWGAYLLGVDWGAGFLLGLYRYVTGVNEITGTRDMVLIFFCIPVAFLATFYYCTLPILQPERFAEMERKAAEAKAAVKDKSTPPKEK